METYLVTGAAGFIGSEVALELLLQGFNVVGVDNMNDYYDVRLKKWRVERLNKNPRFQFYDLDIENARAVDEVFGGREISAVINLAARAGVRYSMENPTVYMMTNALGSLNLLEGMRRHKVKKFVLASTSSLYAGQEMPFLETLPVNTPISPYAASKKAAEAMAYSYHHLYEVDVSIVRYFTVYGPAGRPDMSIYRFIEWIREGKPIELFGDGSQARDFTFVRDIARGTVLALRHMGFEIINLGGGNNPVSLNEIIGTIEEEVDKTAIIERKPFHKADMMETWADIEKAKRLLDWRPEVGLVEGLKETVKWHSENRALLDEIVF